MVLLLRLWLLIDVSVRKDRAAVSTMREDYWCFKMKGIIAGVLIVIVGVIALAVTGFIQIVRAWSDIFR